MSGSQTTPFTAAEITDIRRYCGFPAYAAFGYIIAGGDMATLDKQLSGMSNEEQSVVRTTYLPTLSTLETAVPTAGVNIGTDVAAVWTRNKNEAVDRMALFNMWRRRLCNYIGVEPGIDLRPGGRVVRC